MWTHWGQCTTGWVVDCLTSQQHASYLRDGPAQTSLHAATLRQKLQIKLSTLPSHSILTPDQPVRVLTLRHQAPGRVATGVPSFKLLVWLSLEKSPQHKRELNADALTTRPMRWLHEEITAESRTALFIVMVIQLIDPCEWHIDLYNEPGSGGQPSCMAKTLMLDITCKLFYRFLFQTRHARHHWLLSIPITFTDLDFARTSQGQRKAKPLGFIFSHTFELIRIDFDVVVKQL